MPPAEGDRLRDMLEAAQTARQHSAGKSFDDLESDELLQLALIRLIEVIGEAAKYVSDPTRSLIPEIPWGQVTGTRDRLIHGYSTVDLTIVWEIVADDLPVLIESIQAFLAREDV
jgi:uncharacterized protein with HEPN domain